MAYIKFMSVISIFLINLYKVDSLGIPNLPLFPKGELFERCSTKLDCTYLEIDQIPMEYREDMLRRWQDRVSTVIPSKNGFKKWEALAGVIEFFVAQGWGDSGTWVSIVDATILEGVERGVAMLLHGTDLDDFGNPGAQLWKQYLIDLKNGLLTIKSDHDKRWSECEQSCTEKGVANAMNLKVAPTETQQVVYYYTDYYRSILRNENEWEPKFSDFCSKLFFNWLTNVEDHVPTFSFGNLVTVIAPTYDYFNPLEMFSEFHELYKELNPYNCPIQI